MVHGVPKGPILGPLLFLLYINAIPLSILGVKLVIFVDDTNMLIIDKMLSNKNFTCYGRIRCGFK
jgi:hypothetical protein